MSISKPRTIDELYLFFIKGLPREPISTIQNITILRRKGWNIMTDYAKDNWLLSVSYYSNWKQDTSEWSLNTLKYI